MVRVPTTFRWLDEPARVPAEIPAYLPAAQRVDQRSVQQADPRTPRAQGIAVRKLTATEQRWREVGETSERAIESCLRENRPLDRRDESWLIPLQQTFGVASVQLPDPREPSKMITLDARLAVDSINTDRVRILTVLKDTLHAMRAATEYEPSRRRFRGYDLSIHNTEVARLLRPSYDSEAFEDLFGLCKRNGVFRLTIDKATGIGRTTQIDESEDDIMSQFWVTDTIRCGELEKEKHPTFWRKALLTLGKFYSNERSEFERVIRDPASYRVPGSTAGVHHMFSKELLRYPWLHPKRLESHGLALNEMCVGLIAGMFEGQKWGFSRVPDPIIQSIALLARYLEAVEYWTAPSNGIWEELSFQGGLTWDIEACRNAFASLRDLLFNPEYEKSAKMRRVRKHLRRAGLGEKFDTPEKLDRLIECGRQRVIERVARHPPLESEHRGADASLACVASSGVELSDDPLDDVDRHLDILRYLEETLVGDNGIVKYAPFEITLSDGSRAETFDSYLAPNWGLAADPHGNIGLFKEEFERRIGYPITHLEPSTADNFVTRSRFTIPGKPAEWFLVADMAAGYGRQLEKLLSRFEADTQRPPTCSSERSSEGCPTRSPTEGELARMRTAYRGATQYINRSYARITGSRSDGGLHTKANGRPCPAWSIPEAFQHVSTFDLEDPNHPGGARRTAMLPGVNTPLSWAACDLARASKLYAKNLRSLENLGLFDSVATSRDP